MNARVLSLAFVLMLLATTVASAQTRRIGHRSHSGSPATFAMMLGEDHLGGPAMEFEPSYEVDPFIARVRRYYEQVAKRNPQPKVEVKRSEMDSIPAKPNMGNPPTQESPAPNLPKSKEGDPMPQAEAQPIAPPPFLVKARKPAAITAEKVPQSGLWMLWGLLAFPVAPGIFLASALMQRKPRV